MRMMLGRGWSLGCRRGRRRVGRRAGWKTLEGDGLLEGWEVWGGVLDCRGEETVRRLLG